MGHTLDSLHERVPVCTRRLLLLGFAGVKELDIHMKAKKGQKPLYRIYMGRDHDGYYKGSSHWQPVSKADADKLTHKEANKLEGQLRRLGYKGASMQPV